MKKLTFGPIFVIAALLLSSCQFHTGLGSLFSGKSSSSATPTKAVKATHTPPSSNTSSGTQAVGTPIAGSPGSQIIITSTGVQPATLQVKVGTTITITNQDSVAHTLVYGNQHGTIAAGATSSITLNTAGTITYYLDSASSVTYTVVVTP